MRSTNERMELLKKRTAEIKEKRSAKKYRIAVISSYAAGIAFVAAISMLVCNMEFDGFEKISAQNTASIFADKLFLGYIVVGILAFLLGVFVTLLCNILRKKKNKEHDDDRTYR